MKRLTKILSALLILTLFTALIPVYATAAETVTATPTTSSVVIQHTMGNSTEVLSDPIYFPAYTINGNNYFKLRDLTYALGAVSPAYDFYVTWDTSGAEPCIYLDIAGIRSGYKPVGGEMESKGAGNKIATPAVQLVGVNHMQRVIEDDVDGVISRDGSAFDYSFYVYTIEGNNYVKLRSIARLLNHYVEYDGKNDRIIIDTGKPYRPEGFVAFAVNGIYESMSLADAEKLLGSPYRVLDNPAKAGLAAQQHRFYGDYTKFSALTVDVGDQPKVIGYYTNYGIENATGHDFTREVDREGNYYAIQAGTTLQSRTADVAEQVIFELTNALRGFYEIAPLKWDDELAASARSHSEYMSKNGTLTHDVFEGEVRYTKGSYGENASEPHGGAYGNFIGWVSSKTGHFQNMLTAREFIGVGYHDGYATQRFAGGD